MKMSQEKNQLSKEFEKEVWLFIDRELPEERMSFWQKKLKEIPELNDFIEDYRLISESYEEVKEIQLDSDKFNTMINKAVNRNSIIIKTRIFLENTFSTNSDFAFGKIAFASALIIAAVAISFLSNRPNPVVKITNSINSEILEWDADFVDNQISKVGTLLRVAKDEDYRKYYKYKLSTPNVDKNLNNINRNIKSLRDEINNTKL